MRFNRKWLASGLAAVALAAVVGGAALAQSGRSDAPVGEPVENELNGTAEDKGEGSAEDAAEGDDTPISDAAALEKASANALGWLETEKGLSGRVTDTEVGDEESYYEIEVTLDDGRQVDVQLDEWFDVVGVD